MLIFRPGDEITVSAVADARLMLLGGETMDGPRDIKWNFVHSDMDAIHAAEDAWKAADWESGPFTLPPDDDREYISLS
jgi:redox-sensitive bicupin YhaK (pirin superfamily)